MEYQYASPMILVRLEPGEDLVESLLTLAKKENITLAQVNGLGAVNEVEVGLFDPVTKAYHKNHFTGDYEMVSLSGTLTTMAGEPYLHLHAAFGNREGEVVGGHLNRAIVSATAELTLLPSQSQVDRTFSEKIGLNLLDFQ